MPEDIPNSTLMAPWRQGELVELTIDSLSNRGDGVGRWRDASDDVGKVVFVPDTVPGDRIQARLLQVKPTYAHGKLHRLLQPSPHRIRPGCIVADKCGGCQWQPVAYEQQLIEKRNEVIQALERIGGLSDPPVDAVLPSAPLGYRNKATYPLRQASHLVSDGDTHPPVQAGYYRKGSHKLVNLNQCPIQDPRLNPLLAGVKPDIQQRGWSIYDERTHQGQLRHLSLRVGRHTGEILLTLVSRDADLPGLEEQAKIWGDRHPNLVGVLLNLNPHRGNAIFGDETRLITGRPYLWERFADLDFHISATTFFQVNTEQAEALLDVITDELNLQGHELLLDVYCGIGTLTLPLAQRVQRVIGIESLPESAEQAQQNAALNGIENVSFQVGTAEEVLPQIPQIYPEAAQPDIVLLDPPRKGCDRTVIEALRTLAPERIVYVSCNPATLARDLNLLCAEQSYELTRVQPADFFPQTAHVECAAFLQRSRSTQNLSP